MTHILQFVENTASDLRGGRQSWRVLMLLWTVSLSVAVAVPTLLPW
jgi:hypothetical protein